MRESPPHILSRKTFRGAALAVASFSVLSGAIVLADGAEPSEGKADYSIESASDTLAAILKDAQEKGIVRRKPGMTGAQPEPEKQPASNDVMEISEVKAEPFSCDTAELLDFSDLEDFRTYEALSDAKANFDPETGSSGTLSLARAYLALGLGDEALDILHSENSAAGQRLKQVAKIITFPEVRPDEPVLSEYKDCSAVASLWAFLEAPTQFSDPLKMTDIRNIYYALDGFPPNLKERVLITSAIVAAESNHRNVAQYIWERLENKAREDGTILPKDDKSDFDYIYLSALMQKDTMPDKAVGKFNFLSERDSIYRANSINYLAEMKSLQGKAFGATLEADLEDVSARLKESSGKQQAAYQLISGQLAQNRLNDSIYSAQTFLEEGTLEYEKAQGEISALLDAHLHSENKALQSSALDTFLRQADFLKKTADWENLKSTALEASLSLGMPELVTAIQQSDERFNNAQRGSLEKARILLDMKSGRFDASKYKSSSPVVLRDLENSIMEYALVTSDLDLAKLALKDMTLESKKSSHELNLAWLEQDWSQALMLSEREKNIIAEAGASDQKAQPSNSDNSSSILNVLAKPTLDANDLQGSKWRKSLAEDLSDMEEQIKISKAFLSHG
ncbi:hypothetical protein [Litorimonas sp.]|uniref:hypothetical protein n=1 Tax=Litorimonas sp. TaxID=1892381 RepID=UPI003A83C597